MPRPSRHFTTWNEKPDPLKEALGLYIIIAEARAKIDFTALCDRASAIRSKINGGKGIPCKVDTTVYQSGWFNIVYEIEFEDDVYWISRIQLPKTNKDASQESQAEIMRSEYFSMKYIKEHTTIPLPEVFDFNIYRDSEKNPIGYPYIIMEGLDGRALIGEFQNIIPLQHQDKVLSQLADYREQLSSLRFPKIGRLDATEGPDGQLEYTIKPVLHPAGCQWRQVAGPFDTAIDYFFTSRKLDYEETVLRWPHDSDECFAAWLRWQAAIAAVDLDFNYGPFPLHHLDLRLVNVLFDDEYNVAGIIDWSYVMTVPVEVLANFQHDLGSKYCRERFIKYLKFHESRRDPNTPYANYFASQEPGVISIFPLQELTRQPFDRMRVGKELLTLLYGKSTSWSRMKRTWQRTSMYKVPKVQDTKTVTWVLSGMATLAVVAGAWIFARGKLPKA